MLAAILVFSACAAGKQAPPAVPADSVAVSLVGARCLPLGTERNAPGFFAFQCATDDAVDAPHVSAGERHGIVVIVRVPFAEVQAFAKAHPEPPALHQGMSL